MLTNNYKTMTGMQSDTYFTGKMYPKLDAFIQNGKDAQMFYYASSNQYKTHKSFERSIRERVSLREDAIIKIKKGV
jgi:hypothetical protein